MEVDSLSSSHPVSTPVENPTQIQEMFDDVSYDKVNLGCYILFHVPVLVSDIETNNRLSISSSCKIC